MKGPAYVISKNVPQQSLSILPAPQNQHQKDKTAETELLNINKHEVHTLGSDDVVNFR